MRKNAKESVNCNGVNPECGVQVEENPDFASSNMVNVPLWNDSWPIGEAAGRYGRGLGGSLWDSIEAHEVAEKKRRERHGTADCPLVPLCADGYEAPLMKSLGRSDG